MATMSNLNAFYHYQAERIADAFEIDDDKKVAELCNQALMDPKLPRMHRAKFEIYMAHLSDDPETRLKEAEYWIDQTQALLDADGITDDRVTQLKKRVAELRASIEEVTDDESEDEEVDAPVEKEQQKTGDSQTATESNDPSQGVFSQQQHPPR